MNVKIVTTVPIETIPEKISDTLTNLSNKLFSMSESLEYCSRDITSKHELLQQLEYLDGIRKQLSLIDLNIEDCYSILKGYISFHYKLMEQQTEVTDDHAKKTTGGEDSTRF